MCNTDSIHNIYYIISYRSMCHQPEKVTSPSTNGAMFFSEGSSAINLAKSWGVWAFGVNHKCSFFSFFALLCIQATSTMASSESRLVYIIVSFPIPETFDPSKISRYTSFARGAERLERYALYRILRNVLRMSILSMIYAICAMHAYIILW